GFAPYQYLQDKTAHGKRPIALELGQQSRQQTLNRDGVLSAIRALEKANSHLETLMALRLFQISLGDVGAKRGLPQAFESYQAQNKFPSDLTEPAKTACAKLLVSNHPNVVTEAIRCLAMGKLIDGKLLNEMLGLIHQSSSPSFDIHVLAAIAQSESKLRTSQRQVAQVLLDIQRKIDEQKLNQDRNWEPRFKEILRKLIQSNPKLIAEIRSVGISRPGQIFLFDFVETRDKSKAVDRYLKSLKESGQFQITSDMIHLLASTHNTEHFDIIRNSFQLLNVRDTVIELLARKPVEQDRNKFVAGLRSPQVKTVRVSAQALFRLPKSRNPEEQFALANAMQRISPDKEGYQAREWIVRVLQKNMNKSFGFVPGTDGYNPQTEVQEDWFKLLSNEFPKMGNLQKLKNRLWLTDLTDQLSEIPWEKGNTNRGAKLYTTLSCAKCHGTRNRLGPDLAGVSKRFSRHDLFRSIVEPSLQVSSRYQTTLFETEDGKLHSGIVIYDSVDGVLIRDSDNRTIRIEKSEISKRQKVARSLMPNNLLKELKPQEFADLYAYLKSL
ncbi:MAG: hypothetical protein VX438_08300, partial [Planctomycetota bacterium]|nr:hypothetical protein [Planctomycetota bacterium]